VVNLRRLQHPDTLRYERLSCGGNQMNHGEIVSFLWGAPI
jgi:hypothetical protein